MARLLEVLPARLVALVVVPLLFGLVVLGTVLDLSATAWAFVYLVVIGGVLLIALIGIHIYLQEHQQGNVETGE